MGLCFNEFCELELLENGICPDGHVAEEIAAVELEQEAAVLSTEGRMTGGIAGAILREEGAVLAVEAAEEQAAAGFFLG